MKKTTIITFIAAIITVCGNVSLIAGKGPGVYPIYDIDQECLLGAWTEDGWIMADSAAQYMKGGEKYSVYTMYKPYTSVNGQKPHNSEMGACPEMLSIEFEEFESVEERLYAFSGEWNALPRIPDTIKANARINSIVKAFLKKNGIKNPKSNVTSVHIIDIEGRGQMDTIITATRYKQEFHMPPKHGDYSIVILQRSVDGKSLTIPLATDIHTKPEESLMYENQVLGFFDFNNDSRLEILLNESYYEGSYSVLIGVENNESKNFLDCGCGL